MVVSKAASDAASPTRDMSDDSSINELSRLLLQGWTMLAETCPRPNCHMPLARSRAGRVVCTHCHADVVTSVPEPSTPASAPVPASTPAPATAPVTATAPATATAPSPAGGEASREGLTTALGQKLLQGWTLMDDACQTCSTPLVRDARGRVVCVACEEGEKASGEAQALISNADERRVVHNGERRVVNHDSARAEAEGAMDRVPERRVERLERRVEPVGERRVESMGERRVERVERRVGDRREPSSGTEGRRTTTVARVDQGMDIDVDVDEELVLCEEAAARRLRSLRARLSRVEDAEACRVLCAAMTEACNAIRASRQARGLPRGA